jgi:dynein heavy chain, axonemal
MCILFVLTVATRGSVLYFLIVEMSIVNTMYQTSLKQFLQVFDLSMARSTKSPVTTKRIQNIIEYLTFSTFAYTVRGLYEKDKFLFTILMTLKIQLQAKVIRPEEFQCFIKGKLVSFQESDSS